jgi:5-(carboxyamino)imidazole ribonucleotide mutase
MKALVLFGSTSDKLIYDELCAFLEKDFDIEMQVISAHRDPQKLDERLAQDDFDFIVAGAGLAAHLPGVCASKTKKPVLGIPVEGNLQGLDALLSIQQMPFGIPVAALSPKNWPNLKTFFTQTKTSTKKINIIAKAGVQQTSYFTKEVSRTEDYAQSLNYEFSINNYDERALNINFVTSSKDVITDLPVINVPLLDDHDKNSAHKAIDLLSWVNHGGLWMGINNARNAVCFFNKCEA